MAGGAGEACAGARAQAPRQFTKTLTLRANNLDEVRKIKDALSGHLQNRAGIDHSLPRGCELDTLDDGTAKLSITVTLPYPTLSMLP